MVNSVINISIAPCLRFGIQIGIFIYRNIPSCSYWVPCCFLLGYTLFTHMFCLRLIIYIFLFILSSHGSCWIVMWVYIFMDRVFYELFMSYCQFILNFSRFSLYISCFDLLLNSLFFLSFFSLLIWNLFTIHLYLYIATHSCIYFPLSQVGLVVSNGDGSTLSSEDSGWIFRFESVFLYLNLHTPCTICFVYLLWDWCI